MNPDPDGKMGFCPIEQLLHSFHYKLRHTLKTGMLEPVLGCVFSERKFHQTPASDVFVKVQ
jgi:hypothetical protein